MLHEIKAAVSLGTGYGEKHHCAPHERGAGAEGHQGIHIGRSIECAFEAVYEKFLVNDHDREGQEHLHNPIRRVVSVKKRGKGPVEEGVPAGHIHERGKKNERPDEAAPENR